jgi:hypothetical protein
MYAWTREKSKVGKAFVPRAQRLRKKTEDGDKATVCSNCLGCTRDCVGISRMRLLLTDERGNPRAELGVSVIERSEITEETDGGDKALLCDSEP